MELKYALVLTAICVLRDAVAEDAADKIMDAPIMKTFKQKPDVDFNSSNTKNRLLLGNNLNLIKIQCKLNSNQNEIITILFRSYYSNPTASTVIAGAQVKRIQSIITC
jgi:hypothetical protein